MKVSVDASKCQGHNRCLVFAAEFFDTDDMGLAHVKGDGVVPTGDADAVTLAAANCPERAIHVED